MFVSACEFAEYDAVETPDTRYAVVYSFSGKDSKFYGSYCLIDTNVLCSEAARFVSCHGNVLQYLIVSGRHAVARA